MKVISICLLLICSFTSGAMHVELHVKGTVKDTARYAFYFSKGEDFLKQLNYSEAINFYRKALVNPHELVHRLAVNRRLAAAFFYLNKMDSAELYIQKNLGTARSLLVNERLITEYSKTYDVVRAMGIKKGNYNKVKDALIEGIEVLEKNKIENSLLGSHYLNVGIAYWYMGEYDETLKWCRKSLALAAKFKPPLGESLQIRATMTMGLALWNKRDLKTAIDFYKHIFNIIGDHKDMYARDYMLTCNNIGIIYNETGKYDSANLFFSSALAILPNLAGTPFAPMMASDEATFLDNIGLNYAALGKHNEAEVYYRKALKIKIGNFGEDHPALGNTYLNLGEACLKQQKYDESLVFLLTSLRIRKQKFGKNNVQVSKVYNILGDYYFDRGEFRLSKLYFDSALQSNPKIKVIEKDIYKNIREAWYSFSGKMKNLIVEKNNDKLPVKEIESLYSEIESQIIYLYTKVADPIMQDDANLLFDNLFDSYHQLFQKTGNEKFMERLWEISEYKKGFKLNFQLNDLAAMQSMIPEALSRKEKEIKDSLVLFIDRKFENENVDSILFVYKRRYDSLSEALESQYPQYYRLKYSYGKTSLAEAIATVKDKEAMVNYFQTSQDLYTLFITNKEAAIWKNQLTKIDNLCERMNAMLIKRNNPEFCQYSYQLMKELFPDEIKLKNIETLSIVPDGVAWKIHFSSLNRSSKIQDQSTDLLGSTTNIRYQYSFDHLRLADIISKTTNRKILAFSYSEEAEPQLKTIGYSQFRDLSHDLPGASKEVFELSKNWNGDYYFAQLASESLFKEQCRNYQILHLALHGVMDDQNPAYSRLKFNSADETNDGLLYAYEIYGLNINAELVVLTSCNSGSGKIINGEGIESLGRAFAFAGANSLLLSKWEVADATAPIIIKYFYDGLKKGMSKSNALRLAKLKFLKEDADNITSSPYYWDYFYVLGDDKPVKTGLSGMTYLLLAAALSMIIFGTWRFLKHRQLK